MELPKSSRHLATNGKIISKNCELCHSILAQGIPGQMATVSIFDTLQFQHPVPLRNDIWKTAFCSECHKNLYQ